MRQVRLCFSEIRGGSPSPTRETCQGEKGRTSCRCRGRGRGRCAEAVFPSGEGIYDESFDHLVFDSRGERSLVVPGQTLSGDFFHRDLQFVIPFAGRKPNHASRNLVGGRNQKGFLGNEPFVGEKLEGASLTLLEGVRYSVVYRYFLILQGEGWSNGFLQRKIGQRLGGPNLNAVNGNVFRSAFSGKGENLGTGVRITIREKENGFEVIRVFQRAA